MLPGTTENMRGLLAAAVVAIARGDVVLAPPADPSDTTMKLRGPPLLYKYETLEHPADEYSNKQLGQHSPFPKCPRGKFATALLTTDGCVAW